MAGYSGFPSVPGRRGKNVLGPWMLSSGRWDRRVFFSGVAPPRIFFLEPEPEPISFLGAGTEAGAVQNFPRLASLAKSVKIVFIHVLNLGRVLH